MEIPVLHVLGMIAETVQVLAAKHIANAEPRLVRHAHYDGVTWPTQPVTVSPSPSPPTAIETHPAYIATGAAHEPYSARAPACASHTRTPESRPHSRAPPAPSNSYTPAASIQLPGSRADAPD